MANNTDSGQKATPEKKTPVSLVFVLSCLFATFCVTYNGLHKFRNDIVFLPELSVLAVVLILLAIHIWNDKLRSNFTTVGFCIFTFTVPLTVLSVPQSAIQGDVIWVVRDQNGQIKATSTDQPQINIPRSFNTRAFKLPREIFVGAGRTSYGLTPPRKTIHETYQVSLTLEYSHKDIEHLLDLPEYRFHPQKLHWEIKQKIHDQVYKALKDHTQSETITLNVIADAIQKLNTELGTTGIRIEGIDT